MFKNTGRLKIEVMGEMDQERASRKDEQWVQAGCPML